MTKKTENRKIRVHELAKELGLKNSKPILDALDVFGISGKTASSSLEEELIARLRAHLAPSGGAPQGAPQPAAETAQAAKPREEGPARKMEAAQKAVSGDAGHAIEKPAGTSPAESGSVGAGPEVKPAAATEAAAPDEEVELKVPDRFKKDIEAERMEKFKAKPGMQRAFQAIRKVEPRKFADQRSMKRPGRGGAVQKFVRPERPQPQVTAPRKKQLKIMEGATVKEFAELIGVKVPEIIKKFMELGYMPTINQPVDLDAAMLVAEGMGIKLESSAAEDIAAPEEAAAGQQDESKLRPRPPVVTIMGHVDHGKTTLLDAIRKSHITAGEAGGITQHIGAYKVKLGDKEIAFLDTPGHEAFTTLRARGAKVTDIVILVVAADDGVKPQTIEAIDHAKAAGVPIIVAVNKIDKPEANPQRVRQELTEYGIVPEDWGGSNIFVEISAKKDTGIDSLLEMILLQAEMLELKADPGKMAKGVIIEARLDKGKGPVATILVQNGMLRAGDVFLCGTNAGRVRAMNDEKGRRLESAGPSTPVEVIGFNAMPNAGDAFVVMDDERKARQIALSRLQKQRQAEAPQGGVKKITLDELFSKMKEGKLKELAIVLKADAQGSIEALKGSFESITHPEVKVKVIHASIGGINESDVMLAAASNAIIVGFNVRPETKAQQIAEKEGVDLRLYNIIYEAVDDVKKALEGMLEPTMREKTLGRAEVRQVFSVSRLGTIAGCHVLSGMMSRASDGIRVIRDNIVVYQGRIASLKRFKEDVREVQTGYECGILIENFNDIKVGDIFENFVIEKVAAKLA
ncbi:MAG: translation initiation factor IF-2 [Nitrospiraceae bacterium]|nr:translation initiation factor IF-2 [Nitrospiraceae bacterium]